MADKNDRDKRLAEALRANLKRRKQQERARSGAKAGETETAAAPATADRDTPAGTSDPSGGQKS